jgi:hypothetical protein
LTETIEKVDISATDISPPILNKDDKVRNLQSRDEEQPEADDGKSSSADHSLRKRLKAVVKKGVHPTRSDHVVS